MHKFRREAEHKLRVLKHAGVYRILKRYGLSRLPGRTRIRKIHTKRYEKQVPGQQIQVDIKFLKEGGRRSCTQTRCA